jgi:hypothetical protein
LTPTQYQMAFIFRSWFSPLAHHTIIWHLYFSIDSVVWLHHTIIWHLNFSIGSVVWPAFTIPFWTLINYRHIICYLIAFYTHKGQAIQ